MTQPSPPGQPPAPQPTPIDPPPVEAPPPREDPDTLPPPEPIEEPLQSPDDTPRAPNDSAAPGRPARAPRASCVGAIACFVIRRPRILRRLRQSALEEITSLSGAREARAGEAASNPVIMTCRFSRMRDIARRSERADCGASKPSPRAPLGPLPRMELPPCEHAPRICGTSFSRA